MYFEKHPQPFYNFAKEYLSVDRSPTPCHSFLKLLEDKGMFQMCFTSNIDYLEQKTGIDLQNVVYAQGANIGA
jgi:NAD-dependent histone deacetylase SIR2